MNFEVMVIPQGDSFVIEVWASGRVIYTDPRSFGSQEAAESHAGAYRLTNRFKKRRCRICNAVEPCDHRKRVR